MRVMNEFSAHEWISECNYCRTLESISSSVINYIYPAPCNPNKPWQQPGSVFYRWPWFLCKTRRRPAVVVRRPFLLVPLFPPPCLTDVLICGAQAARPGRPMVYVSCGFVARTPSLPCVPKCADRYRPSRASRTC